MSKVYYRKEICEYVVGDDGLVTVRWSGGEERVGIEYFIENGTILPDGFGNTPAETPVIPPTETP